MTQKSVRDCCNYNYNYDGYVFVVELRNRMKGHYLICQFPKFIEKHGMRKMRFFDLRHSCESLLLAEGVGMKQVSCGLGISPFPRQPTFTLT